MVKFSSHKASGQAIVEAVLIIILFLGGVTLVSSTFQEQEWVSRLVKGPWQRLSGLVQAGVWDIPERSRDVHPNKLIRAISLEGDKLP